MMGKLEANRKCLLALAAALLLSGSAVAQASGNLTDSQVEGNVLKALASEPQLANEHIVSNTVYGTVTLSGAVKDEPARQLAETLASRAAGVKRVVDELTLGGGASDAAQGSNPLLQSDGSYAQPTAPPTAQSAQAHAPDPDTYAAQHGVAPDSSAPAPANQPPYRQPYDAQGTGRPARDGSNASQPPYYGQTDARNQGPNYSTGQPYPQAQRPYPQNGQYQAPPPYGAQVAGQPVTVPSGSLLRIRINEGLDSKHTQPGTSFDGVVLNDVVADGAVAIPRGASVQGKVVEAKSGGVLSGHGEIALQLTQVTLGGKSFPVVSDVWKRDSADKGLQSVNNAVGLGAAGAIIGAIAGGGAGAAIGAGVGGAAGLGTSAASGSRQVLIPSEAILTFHLAQPAGVTTISQAEMDRLSYGVPTGAQQPQMVRRRYAPPPAYYGPGYYPRPYGYPYPY